ncbi:MAG: phosphatase PAP2 family protein [Sneathiella sp.]|nr:phosphatase PAP2 family protein [Sneathiella sp.]
MFQTDINHFLQRYSSDWLDAFMIGVSWTGGQTFLVGVLCLIVLGVDLKRGFLLLQMFLITVIATDVFKTVFELPRPFFVDDTLMSFGALKEGMSALVGGAAQSFMAWPPEQSIEAFRAHDWTPGEYGLPSGHVTSAVALWGGMALVFRKKRIGLFAILMIVLMVISRLYLARHFLADILAGLGLSFFILLISAILLNRMNWQKLFLPGSYSLSEDRGAIGLFFAGFILPVAVLLSGEGHSGRIVALLAVNLALIGLVGIEISFEAGKYWQRALRVVLGIGLYVVLNELVKIIPMDQSGPIYPLIKGFVPVFILFFAAPLLVSFTMRERVVNLTPSQH